MQRFNVYLCTTKPIHCSKSIFFIMAAPKVKLEIEIDTAVDWNNVKIKQEASDPEPDEEKFCENFNVRHSSIVLEGNDSLQSIKIELKTEIEQNTGGLFEPDRQLAGEELYENNSNLVLGYSQQISASISNEDCRQKSSVIRQLNYSKKINKPSQISSEVVEKDEKPFSCNSCNKRFSSKLSLQKHSYTHRPKSSVCDICNKKFVNVHMLKRHSMIHTGERPYVCNVCNKSFSQNGHLKVHARIHTSEKPYKCEVCKKPFSDKSALTRHVIVHTGERPYNCDLCKKLYLSESKFKSHQHRKRSFTCDNCKRDFFKKADLQRHMLTHTKERPHICGICKKGFAHSSALKTHIRIHTGECPYICEICKKGHTDRSDFRRHMLKHTGERPYKCNLCKKGFSQNIHLRRHNAKIHKEILK